VFCFSWFAPMVCAGLTTLAVGLDRASGQGADEIGQALQRSMIWAGDGSAGEASGPPGFVAFRKTVMVAEAPVRADLGIFADSRYLLWINGDYILRGPGRFVPNGPEYDRLDVASHLRRGANTLAILVLARGSSGKMMRHGPGLAVRLAVGDGPVVAADSSWKWSGATRYRQPVIKWGNEYDVVDARVEDGDWTKPEYDDRSWMTAVPVAGEQWGPLTARRSELLRGTVLAPALKRTLPVTLTAGQRLAFQVGRLVQAYTVLDFDAEPGSEIDLDYAGIHYVARGGRQSYISSDTHAFSEGAIAVKSGRVTLRGAKWVELLYPFDAAGSFTSNDLFLNDLWAMCVRSCQLLSEDSYVDCADRERTEWMDDDPPAFDVTRVALQAAPRRATSAAQADANAALLRELLRRTALTLQPGGWVKAHTASDRFDLHAQMEDRSCDWVEGARRYFASTGDAALVREIWPAIAAQMEWFLQRRTERGLVSAREWVVWGNPMGYVVAEGAALNAFVYQALVDAAYLGEQIGERSRAAEFGQAAAQLRAAFNRLLWNEQEGAYYSGLISNPTGQSVPLAERLEYSAVAGGFIARSSGPPLSGRGHLRFNGAALTVDAQGRISSTLFPALFALDQGIVLENRRERVTRYALAAGSQAQRLMTFYYLFKRWYDQNTPEWDRAVLDSMRERWKPMVLSPWQVSWEEFDGGSKAHIYGMYPAYFLSSYVLGVRVEGIGPAKHLLINPRLGDLTSAAGTVVTELGLVRVSWVKQAGHRLAFAVNLPRGGQAKLRLPGTRLMLDGRLASDSGKVIEVLLGAGKHQGFAAED